VISPENDVTRLWLDQKTHLPARMTYVEDGKKIVDGLSDWRNVQGVLLPFKSRHESGTERVDIEYKSVAVNPKLSADLFK
jgi:outer membrane lipoprotein-sorting protein